jgi:hypothetical protein
MLQRQQDAAAVVLDPIGRDGGEQIFFLGKGEGGGTGDAGAAGQQSDLLFGDAGTRSDEAHVAAEDIEELGKLVEFPPAQQAADAGEALVADGGDAGVPRGGGFEHGAEFEDGEGLSVAPDALLQEEDGAAAGSADGDGDGAAQGQKQGQEGEDEGEVAGSAQRRLHPRAEAGGFVEWLELIRQVRERGHGAQRGFVTGGGFGRVAEEFPCRHGDRVPGFAGAGVTGGSDGCQDLVISGGRQRFGMSGAETARITRRLAGSEAWGEDADAVDAEGAADVEDCGDGGEVEGGVSFDEEDFFGAQGVDAVELGG